MVNTDSGKTPKVFTIKSELAFTMNQNGCSRCVRISVHVGPEYASRHKEGFNLNDYANKQGHFGSGELIEFKAKICDHLASMLEETPLDSSQQITVQNETGYREITAIFPNTWQLRWWVLGEGERIEVLKPESFRSEIVRTLQETNGHYLNTHESDVFSLR